MAHLFQILVFTALLATVISSLRVYPHQLAYFNELAGGPANGWRHLLGSNFDWGQDLLFVERAAAHTLSAPTFYIGTSYHYDAFILAPHLRFPGILHHKNARMPNGTFLVVPCSSLAGHSGPAPTGERFTYVLSDDIARLARQGTVERMPEPLTTRLVRVGRTAPLP